MKNLDYYLQLKSETGNKSSYLSLIQENISGGRIAKEDIDVIKQFPNITEVSISWLTQDTFIVGKRKPFLDSVQDKKRIDKYVRQFDDMYQWYTENPNAAPEDYQAT